MVGSATLHDEIVSQYAPADDLPCAAAWLLAPLKKSPEYRVIRPRIANPMAVDSWQDQGVHFFVFLLRPAEGAPWVPHDPPVVVFAMHPEEPEPVSVVVVTPKPGGEEAEVVDLREAGSTYTAAFLGVITPTQESEPEHGGEANQSHPQKATGDAEQPLSAETVALAHEELLIAEFDPAANATGQTEPEIEEAAQPAGDPEPAIDAETLNDHTPDVDLELLSAVKVSPEFQTIQGRLTQSLPAEAWQEGDAHFFAFELLPADGSPPNGHEPPVAVFAMRPPEPMPISAVIVTPHSDGEDADVTDLRQLNSSSIVPGTS